MFFGGFPGFGGGGDPRDSSDNGEVDNKEFYEIIGVPQNASADEIRKEYRKKVIRAHPDKGGDVEEFKKLQAAYEILSNPEKRELYDKYGLDGIKEGGGGGMDPFESMFGGLFGRGRGGGGKPNQKKVKPTIKEVKVTLEDIYNGKMKKVSFRRDRNCEACDGKGGKDSKKCSTCKGHGMVEKVVQLGPGFLSSSRSVCHDCKGEGTTFDKANRCKVCQGNKTKNEEKTLEVPIEQGAPNDHHVLFSGEGDEVPGALAGDVAIKFNVEPHKRFERKGADLYIARKISLYEALTGTAFTIDHLDGKKITIATAPNEVITPGTIKELKGKGMPFFKDAMSHGNLYVKFDIEFPKKNELKNLDQLKSILPVPKEGQNLDKTKAQILEDFDESSTNTNAEGGRSRHRGDDDEDEDGMPRGQRVQCAQQ